MQRLQGARAGLRGAENEGLGAQRVDPAQRQAQAKLTPLSTSQRPPDSASQAPAPEQAHAHSTPESARVDFPCRNCGAQMTWDPDRDVLACEHCQTTLQVPRAEGLIVERPLEEGLAVARGLGVQTRSMRCARCGATIQLSGSTTSTDCVFCGSSQVLDQTANRMALRPESIVPLEFGRDKAEAAVRKWLAGLWLRPNALKQSARFQAQGVYLPYWTYDARVHSDWSADAGHYYYVTEVVPVMVNGKLQMQSRQVRKIRWVPAWGKRDDVYDDVIVHASKGVAEELIARLGGFDTKALVPYRPEYLAGWRAEEYERDLEAGWQHAKEHIVRTQSSRCGADVPGDTQRNLKVDNTIEDVRWKHILLPLWVMTYRHAGRDFRVLINGQSARVQGQAPLSRPKVVLLVLAILTLVGLIVAFAK